ncbi:MAG: Stp1/IreP family PP2C-type Ser/Thr phosphatase [Myxococcota bacterium]
MAKLKVTSCGITDLGRKRQNNEDNYLINDELNLYIVADGMGGHAGGEFASQIAVNTVEEVFTNLDSVIPQGPASGELTQDAMIQEKIEYAIRLAGRRIYEKALEDPEYRGMGTTALGIYMSQDRMFISHVGDSRGYRIRKNSIEQLTEDHSLVNEQIKAGILSPEMAKTHRLKNIITRSLGYQEEVEVDTRIEVLEEGDTFLLCSDGLSNMVEEHEMLELVTRYHFQEAANRLIEAANERGGDDNITVVLARVERVGTRA